MFSIELKKTGTVTIDLFTLTVKDVRDLGNPKQKTAEGDEIMGRACGLTVEQLSAMPYPEYRKLVRFFWKCITDPLKDEDDAKNSLSESISE